MRVRGGTLSYAERGRETVEARPLLGDQGRRDDYPLLSRARVKP